MISASKLMLSGPVQFGNLERNSTLYGSLWVIAACLVVLATLLLPGCSNSSSRESRQRAAGPRCAQDRAGCMEKGGNVPVAGVVIDSHDRARLRMGYGFKAARLSASR